jgi:hypothetical protein
MLVVVKARVCSVVYTFAVFLGANGPPESGCAPSNLSQHAPALAPPELLLQSTGHGATNVVTRGDIRFV